MMAISKAFDFQRKLALRFFRFLVVSSDASPQLLKLIFLASQRSVLGFSGPRFVLSICHGQKKHCSHLS